MALEWNTASLALASVVRKPKVSISLPVSTDLSPHACGVQLPASERSIRTANQAYSPRSTSASDSAPPNHGQMDRHHLR